MHFKDAVALLEAAGVPDAAYETALLFEELGGIPRHRLYAENPDCNQPALSDALKRRSAREPLAYILGEVSFFRERYRVTPDVLIPRADTEVLVEEAIRRLPQGAHFADFCTGSGCIAISVLAARPDCTAIAYDISPSAIVIAKENAKRNGVHDRFQAICADLLHDTVDTDGISAILSNPPYIAYDEKKLLSKELDYEPSQALFADENGLMFYRHSLENYASKLPEKAFFLFEIGYTQSDAVRVLAAKSGMFCTFFKDLGGNTRVALCSSITDTLLLKNQ